MPTEELDVYALVGGIRDKMMPKSEVIVRTALAELGLTGASTLDPKGKAPTTS
ncbi:MAG: hypothetical protein LYZ69_08000 [Nitrososphaerales archaeon]|nr:hypothetical protein [Nitrososphaerales archaeon]